MVIVPLAGWEQSRGALEDQLTAARQALARARLCARSSLGVREQRERELARPELAPLHSITSSAMASSLSGTGRPRGPVAGPFSDQ